MHTVYTVDILSWKVQLMTKKGVSHSGLTIISYIISLVLVKAYWWPTRLQTLDNGLIQDCFTILDIHFIICYKYTESYHHCAYPSGTM